MNQAELEEYSSEIEEMLKEVGTSELKFYRYSSAPSDSLYKENKKKTFAPAVDLVGYPKVKPDKETISVLGLERGATAIFTIGYDSLNEAGLIESPITVNDQMEFGGIRYNIVNVVGAAFISGRYLITHIECRSLENASK
jgi:hypothetical protein